MVEEINIAIGDTVQIKHPIRIVDFDSTTLRVEIRERYDFSEITVPRCISALGQFLPGLNWHIPAGAYVLSDDFNYTGKYYIDDRLYLAQQISAKDSDNFLEAYKGEVLDGAVIVGVVMYIYAEYVQRGQEPIPTDIEFFTSTSEAQHDFYANQVYAIIQDMGSHIEFPVNVKLLKKL